MATWTLRYWPNSEQENVKPEVVTVYDERGIGADLQHYIDKNGATRVEAARRGHPAPKPKPKTVKAQSIEWREKEHPKGALWWGFVGERKVADVFAPSEGNKPSYSLYLGENDVEQLVECSSVESAKRSAQRALNKVVQTLVGT